MYPRGVFVEKNTRTRREDKDKERFRVPNQKDPLTVMKFIIFESVSLWAVSMTWSWSMDAACQGACPWTGQFGGSHGLLVQQPSSCFYFICLDRAALATVFPCLWFLGLDIVSATAFPSYGLSALPLHTAIDSVREMTLL